MIAAGMLVSLWLWAAQNATDGDLSKCSDRAIAEAAEFKRKPSLFVDALIHAKFLDEDRKLHDWDEYATLLIECDVQQREKTRQRVAKHRAKKKAMKETPSNGECNTDGNVTDMQCNALTIPYNTIPYHTIQNSSGAGGESARARAATDEELLSIGIQPGEYLGLTEAYVQEVQQVTYDLFRKYHPQLCPQPWDYRQVSRYCGPANRAHLLDYAFEQAAVAGKLGDWRYIDGIMARLEARNIRTAGEARAFDAERPDLEGDV